MEPFLLHFYWAYMSIVHFDNYIWFLIKNRALFFPWKVSLRTGTFLSIFCLKHIWYETRQKISLENISVKLLRTIYPVQNLKGAGLNFKANWRKVEILNVLTLKRKPTVSDERQIIREVDTCCLEAPNHGDYHKRVVYLILKTPVMF